MPKPQELPMEVAARIAKLEEGDIRRIIQLASLNQKADNIIAHAKAVAEGRQFVLEQSKQPLTIQAWSLVNDPRQYEMWGFATLEAARLKLQLEANPQPAVDEISAHARKIMSNGNATRGINVTLDGMPSPISNDGGAATLARYIAKKAIYGDYSFDPKPTGKVGAEAFCIDLDRNLMVVGQNKKVAIAAARLVRVEGRHFEPVVPYTRIYVGDQILGPNDIAESVYDGKLGN
ncbi:MAG: hypothetical protein M1831_005963 [Alyxoria varia]|nr:MAG: hypothetical protein M1831_005963 [Alyxoria varia]